jgi:hypothetical protein
MTTTRVVCNIAGEGVPLRAEGLTELIGNIRLELRSEGPKFIPQAFNATVILNTNITNRIFANRTADAVAKIRNGAVEKSIRGQIEAPNTIVFRSITMTEPTTTCEVSGIRVNAAMLGMSSKLTPTLVVAYITLDSPGIAVIQEPQVDVGRVMPSFSFSVADTIPLSKHISPLLARPVLFLSFREAQRNAFRSRKQEAEGATDVSMINASGLMATFSSLPPDVELFISRTDVSGTEPKAIYVSDITQAGDPGNTKNTPGRLDFVRVEGGRAIWEWIASDSSDEYQEAIFAVSAVNKFESAREDKVLIGGSFAPVSTVNTPSENAPIPRFAFLGPAKEMLLKSIPASQTLSR